MRVGMAAAAAAFGCPVVPVTTPQTVVPVTTPQTVVPVTTPEAPTVVPVTTPQTVVLGKAEKEVHAGRVAVRSDQTLT